MIKDSGVKVCISCWNKTVADRTARELPGAEICFDGLTDRRKLAYYSSLVGKENFSVWVPVDYEKASWAPGKWFLSEKKAEKIRQYAKLGIWAIASEESFYAACEKFRPFAAETNGALTPDE